MLELLLCLGALAISSDISCWSGLDFSRFGCSRGAGLSPDPFNLFWWRRDPLGALPWFDAGDVHGINLFKGSALAFHDEEVDQKDPDQIATCEHVSVEEIDVTSDEGGEEGDEEVPEPVRGGG